MRVGQHELTRDSKVLFVAELGGNHNGSVEHCIHLIRLAAEAGADAVKAQKRTIPDAIPEAVRGEMRDTPWGRMSYVDYRAKMEFGQAEYDRIAQACEAFGIPWFVSVWDESAVEFMERYDPPCYKVPSACITDKGLLDAIRKTTRPAIISTGASTFSMINDAVHGFDKLVLCQTTSSYPTALSDVNLEYITVMKALWPHIIPGYSGHELDIAPTIGAAVLGARYIERHFTDDKSQWGSDQSISLLPDEFRLLVSIVRDIEVAMGDGIKRLLPSEERAMKKLRRFASASQVRETAAVHGSGVGP